MGSRGKARHTYRKKGTARKDLKRGEQIIDYTDKSCMFIRTTFDPNTGQVIREPDRET
jgi:hypothetical protein